jgi:REP element-mobilizing transposase RayT
MSTANQINLMRKAPGHPIWQRNYFEHIVRDDKNLSNARDYIANNPFKWLSEKDNPENHAL